MSIVCVQLDELVGVVAQTPSKIADKLVGVVAQAPSTITDKRKRSDIRGYFTKNSTPGRDVQHSTPIATGTTTSTSNAACPPAKKPKLLEHPYGPLFHRRSHLQSNTESREKCYTKPLLTFGAWNVNSLCARLRNDVWAKAIRTFLHSTGIQCFFLSEVKLRAAGPHRWQPSNCADKKSAGEYELIQRHLRKGGAFEVTLPTT